MRTARRRIDPGLIEQLAADPQRFEFFQAVRLLERHFIAEAGDGAASPVADRVRFRNTIGLGFAPSQVEALAIEYDGDEHGAAPASASTDGTGPAAAGDGGKPPAPPSTPAGLHRTVLTPAFIGLLGRHGVLPLHYTERIAERERYHRDHAARAFFDLFSNRAVGQFYRAWKKYRLPLEYESDRRNRFLPQVLALCGLGQSALRDRLREGSGAVDDESIAHFAGLLRQRPLSAAALEQVLAAYFRIPVRIEQFVGKWYTLPAGQKSSLGGSNALLGKTALLGERVWQRNLCVRVHLGPLARQRYRAFLPGRELAAALHKLITLAAGTQFEFEIRPVLRAADVAPCSLAADDGARLGFDAFLTTRPCTADRGDAAFALHAVNAHA